MTIKNNTVRIRMKIKKMLREQMMQRQTRFMKKRFNRRSTGDKITVVIPATIKTRINGSRIFKRKTTAAVTKKNHFRLSCVVYVGHRIRVNYLYDLSSCFSPSRNFLFLLYEIQWMMEKTSLKNTVGSKSFYST